MLIAILILFIVQTVVMCWYITEAWKWKNKYARKRLDYYAIKSVLDAKLHGIEQPHAYDGYGRAIKYVDDGRGDENE